MAKVQKNSTKYVAMVGKEIAEEFNSMTAAMIWRRKRHLAGDYAAEIWKVENHVVKQRVM